MGPDKPNQITKKEYRTNRMLYPLWKDGTTAADVYWAEEMDNEFNHADGSKKQNNMTTPNLSGFKPRKPLPSNFQYANGYSNYDGPTDAQMQQSTDIILGWIKGIKAKQDAKNNPPQPTYTPPPPPPAPVVSTGWSTGKIIGVSLAGLAVGTGIFFGVRYLINRGKNKKPVAPVTA